MLYYFFNWYNSDMTGDGTSSLRAVIVFLLCHFMLFSACVISEPHYGHKTDCFLLKARIIIYKKRDKELLCLYTFAFL